MGLNPKKVLVCFFVFKNSSRANVLVQFMNLCSKTELELYIII